MYPKPQIAVLRSGKTQCNRRLIGLAILIATFNILFHFGCWQFGVWSPFALLSLSLFFLVFLQLKKNQQLLHSQKKEQIIQMLLSSGFSKASLHPKKKVFQKDFIKSRLYDNLPFIYTGDNLLRAENWFISNVTVARKLAKSKEAVVVFDGVFAKLKNQKPIDGLLIIKPLAISDKTEIPEVLQRLMHRYFTATISSVATGNSAFDKAFEVFSSSPELQTKVLNSSVINNILELKQKLQNNRGTNSKVPINNRVKNPVLEISFVEDYIYVGIRGIKLFSPKGNRNSNYESESFQKCIEFIKLTGQINNTSKPLNN
jgi:heme exporter protein D